MKKKQYDDDDGRTIADKSGVGPRNIFLPRRPEWEENKDIEGQESGEVPREELLQGKDRRAFIFGALGAALAIAAVFLAGLALVIFLMIFFWSR